jgi:shikimate dehydrogenase
MDAYGLFGYPVHHSWSPFIHGLFARQTGQQLTYHLFESEPSQFRHDVLDFFFNQNGCGCNVTLPHKRAAAELVNELTPRAQRADAVNTILRREDRLIGDNTDGTGLLTDLRQNLGLRFNTPRILMLGAGGAARGVLEPLLSLHPAVLLIANRTPARAVELASEFSDLGATRGASFDAAALQQPFDLIVNATSATLQGTTPPVPARAVGPKTMCYDMAYALGETPFTHWARQAGAAVVAQGWGMLVEQAALAFELWRGVRPVTRPVLNALQEHAAAMAAARNPA